MIWALRHRLCGTRGPSTLRAGGRAAARVWAAAKTWPGGQSGVKLIARARQGLPAGRDVIIRDPNPCVHRMLALTGIDQVCIIEGQRLPPLPGTQSTA